VETTQWSAAEVAGKLPPGASSSAAGGLGVGIRGPLWGAPRFSASGAESRFGRRGLLCSARVFFPLASAYLGDTTSEEDWGSSSGLLGDAVGCPPNSMSSASRFCGVASNLGSVSSVMQPTRAAFPCATLPSDATSQQTGKSERPAGQLTQTRGPRMQKRAALIQARRANWHESVWLAVCYTCQHQLPLTAIKTTPAAPLG